ncbi:MAG: hypothetical protein ABFE07_00350 [Armatimonadia bacterium]
MRTTTLGQEEEQQAFAKRAAEAFAANPSIDIFGNIEPGSFLALRWGLGDDCVLVVKLSEGHEPTNYQRLIKAIELAKIPL